MPAASPEHVAAVLVAVTSLVWLYNQVMIATGRRDTQQPFRVSLEKEFASRGEHEELKRSVARHQRDTEQRISAMSESARRSDEKMYALVRDMDSRSEARSKEIHERINEVAGKVSGLANSDQHTGALLARMDQKMDALNQRKADRPLRADTQSPPQ